MTQGKGRSLTEKRGSTYGLGSIRALGEVAGAVGVILSMLYLSRQITENTRLTRQSTHNDTMSKFIDVMIANAQNKEISAIIIRGMQNPTDLDQAELTVFTQRIATYFMAGLTRTINIAGAYSILSFGKPVSETLPASCNIPAINIVGYN